MKLHKEMWDEFNISKQLIETINDEYKWIIEKSGDNNLPSSIKSHPDSLIDECGFIVTFGWLFLNVELKRYSMNGIDIQKHTLCKKKFFFTTKINKKLQIIRKKIQQEIDDIAKDRIMKNMPINIIRDNNLDDLLD